MSSQPDNDEALPSSLAEHSLARKSWRPQVTLGSLILLVMLVALGTAFLVNSRAKTQELEQLKVHYEAAARKQQIRQQNKENALSYVTQSATTDAHDVIVVNSENAFGTNRNQYSILVYLDPEKSYLLHYATQNIPLAGMPTPQTTYHLPAVGKRESSCFFTRFLVRFEHKEGQRYEDVTQPYEGCIEINPYFNCSANIGETDQSWRTSWQYYPLRSEKLKFQKPQQIGDRKIEDWTHWLLYDGQPNRRILPEYPAQLVRLRAEPLQPEPGPGLMLWIEILGNAPVPPGALPFCGKPNE